MTRILAIAIALALSSCAGASVSCSKIENPTFGERITLAKELRSDGPVSQKWIEKHVEILEACGYR